MMTRLWLFLIFCHGSALFAEASLFSQISNLRFGNEEVVTLKESYLDLTKLPEDSYFHVQGQVLFFPDEFLPLQYLDRSQFQQLVESKKPLRVDLELRGYPHPMEGTDQTFGTFVIYVHNSKEQKLFSPVERSFHLATFYAVSREKSDLIGELGRPDPHPMKNLNFGSIAGQQ